MPLTSPPPAEGHADDNTLAAVVARIDELKDLLGSHAPAHKPLPLLLTQEEAWSFIGVSRAAFFRLKAAGVLPRPVHVEGVGVRYRRADLESFVQRLRPARSKPGRQVIE